MRPLLDGIVLLVAVIAAGACSAGQAGGGSDLPLILDLRAAGTSAATQVRVDTGGGLTVLTWCPYAYRVVSEHTTSLTASERETLHEAVAEAELQRWRRVSEGVRTEPVDLYSLYLGSPPTLVAAGPVAEAPATVRPLLGLLETLAAGQGGREVSAEAYLRSERVRPRRLRRIQHRGQVRLLERKDIPARLGPAIEWSVAHPHQLVGVEGAIAAGLLPLTSHGHDLFVVEGQAAHQIGVFSARRGRQCSSGASGDGNGSAAPVRSTLPLGTDGHGSGG